MFIFERLLSRDLEKVYYIINDELEREFKFYTQDEETIERIISSENWERTFYDIYITLYKVRREKCRKELKELKQPARSKCVKLNYDNLKAERERRKKEGLQTQLRLKD